MASSEHRESLASEEATRVALQSQSVWDALRRPLGPHFEGEHSLAKGRAQALADQQAGQSPHARNLAYHHHLIESAQRLGKSLMRLPSN